MGLIQSQLRSTDRFDNICIMKGGGVMWESFGKIASEPSFLKISSDALIKPFFQCH